MESDTPIELLVSREWNGTKWHYPNIERMVEENKRLRAELAAAKQRVAVLERELAVDTMAVIAAMRKGESDGK